MINSFHYSCEGENHKATNKVCQDYSLTSNNDGLIIAIVCDGHGGERYFRSDIGAKYAAEVTLESVSVFVEQIESRLFLNRPYTANGPMDVIDDAEQLSETDVAFRRLFSSIIYKWNERIEQHAKETALTDWEKGNVPPKYLDEFASASSYEKYYGCTLMTYVQTSQYWFAFHLGDGKCISFQDEPLWKEPIPWDDRCFLNKTTSLCDTSAIDEFRYCYQGDGNFPFAVFLGSDGMDDSFGEDENLVNFYIQIMKMLVNEGNEATEHSIEIELPKLSAIGSKDDMSISYVYDEDKLISHFSVFLQYQLDKTNDAIRKMEEKLNSLSQKLENVQEKAESDDKARIEANYAQQDIIKTKDNLLKLQNRRDTLLSQFPVQNPSQDNNKLDGEEQNINT